MSLIAPWATTLGICLWAAYLFHAWRGAKKLPMQWGLTGKPTWFADKSLPLTLFPATAIFVCLVVSFGKHAGPAFPVTLLILAIQALWIFLARHYVQT